MSLENIRIVLVEPQHGGNIGSVCRAMQNMGLSKLVLVRPPPGIADEMLRKMALAAITVYDQRAEYPSLQEAVGDCHAVAATSARTGLYRAQAVTPRTFAPICVEAAAAGPVALVFGREDKGLCNDDLKIATHILQIPSAPEYLSLNLAQAVMVCAYEIYVAAGTFQPAEETSPDAPVELRERMFEAWREAMLDTGFSKEDKLEHMMMGLRRILTRGKLTEADAKILMGLARQSQWAARHHPSPSEPLPPES